MLGPIIPFFEANYVATTGSSAPIGITSPSHNRPHHEERVEACYSGGGGSGCGCHCSCPGCMCKNRHDEDANRNNYGEGGQHPNGMEPVQAMNQLADDFGSLMSATSFGDYYRLNHSSEAPAPITSALNDENLRQVNSQPDQPISERHRLLLDFLEVENFPDRVFLSPEEGEALDASMMIDGEAMNVSMQDANPTNSGGRSMLSSRYEPSFARSSVANSVILTGAGTIFNRFIPLGVVNHPQYMSSVTPRRQH